MHLTAEAIARFNALVKSGGGCWEWQGGKDRDGYGRMRIGGRKASRAHRIAWFIANGDPGTLLVCHHCDNPSCVRPAHLFIGTALDNNRDRVSKGRSNASLGEHNGLAKLTEEQAKEIVDLYRDGGARQKDLAACFGVSQSAVQLILSGKRWKHAGIEPVHGMRNAPKPDLRALTSEAESEIVSCYLAGGVSQLALAKRFGVSQQLVSLLLRKHRSTRGEACRRTPMRNDGR
jgi:transposase